MRNIMVMEESTSQICAFIRTLGKPDMSLIAGTKLFRVHKVMFASSSNYLLDILLKSPSSYDFSYVLEDVSVEDVENLLTFVYEGTLAANPASLTGLLRAAEQLKIDSLLVQLRNKLAQMEQENRQCFDKENICVKENVVLSQKCGPGPGPSTLKSGNSSGQLVSCRFPPLAPRNSNVPLIPPVEVSFRRPALPQVPPAAVKVKTKKKSRNATPIPAPGKDYIFPEKRVRENDVVNPKDNLKRVFGKPNFCSTKILEQDQQGASPEVMKSQKKKNVIETMSPQCPIVQIIDDDEASKGEGKREECPKNDGQNQNQREGISIFASNRDLHPKVGQEEDKVPEEQNDTFEKFIDIEAPGSTESSGNKDTSSLELNDAEIVKRQKLSLEKRKEFLRVSVSSSDESDDGILRRKKPFSRCRRIPASKRRVVYSDSSIFVPPEPRKKRKVHCNS